MVPGNIPRTNTKIHNNLLASSEILASNFQGVTEASCEINFVVLLIFVYMCILGHNIHFLSFHKS